RDADLGSALERGYLDLAAQRRRGDADRHLAMQIVSFPLEYRVRLDAADDIQVPGRTAVDPGFSFAREADAVAFVYARRDLHRQRLLPLDASLAMTARTGIANHLAGAAAAWAGLGDRE